MSAHPPGVLSLSLALALREAGLRWEPAPGDRFVLPHRGMDDEVFVLSDMTVEVHQFPTGPVIGFNGVAEWALDSIDQEQAVWLPGEDQLRHRLGGLFLRLEGQAGGPDGEGGFRVTLTLPEGVRAFPGTTAADAYAASLLWVLRDVRRSDGGRADGPGRARAHGAPER